MILGRLFFLAFLAICAGPAAAAGLALPTGPIVLTVRGAIETANAGEAAVFDMEMLERLDWREIRTFTNYTDGPQTFAGPTLASLLDTLGVRDGRLRAAALDDYAVEIPVTDLAEHEILLAVEHNGARMRVRDRGPIWVIYPAASGQDIQQRHISHSIWQLTSIDVLR